MPHVIEAAATARSKCRGCSQLIPQSELRFGERIANPYANGETTLWFHLQCAAYKRPEPFLDALARMEVPPVNAQKLRDDAERGIALRRLARIDGVDRATGARARCHGCREMIVKGEWRIPLVFYAEGAFNRRGFVHVRCAQRYFDTADVLERMCRFNAALDALEMQEIRAALDGGAAV